jgi:hypothetical protein
VVSATSSSSATVVASCATGKVALGGGANPANGRTLNASYPSGINASNQATSWTGIFSGSSSSNVVYVICAS